jgi:hypothetical protein
VETVLLSIIVGLRVVATALGGLCGDDCFQNRAVFNFQNNKNNDSANVLSIAV